MLREFLALNKTKIYFGLKFASILFTAIVLGVFAWGIINTGKVVELNLFLSVIIVAAAVFPISIVALGILTGYLKYKRGLKILSTYPYSELINHGFQRTTTDQKDDWNFSQVMFIGQFDGYPVECVVEEDGILRFIALTNRDDFKKENFNDLKQLFGKRKVEYHWTGIALCFNVHREKITEYDQLKGQLERFINFFTSNGLKASDDRTQTNR